MCQNCERFMAQNPVNEEIVHIVEECQSCGSPGELRWHWLAGPSAELRDGEGLFLCERCSNEEIAAGVVVMDDQGYISGK